MSRMHATRKVGATVRPKGMMIHNELHHHESSPVLRIYCAECPYWLSVRRYF